MEVAKLDAERAAMSRLDKIRVDQGARAAALEQEAAASEARATLIEYNLDTVDAAIDAVNAGGAGVLVVEGRRGAGGGGGVNTGIEARAPLNEYRYNLDTVDAAFDAVNAGGAV